MRSSLTLPLKVEGRPIGVVFFTSISVRAFTESHVGLLKRVAGQLSVLIEKGRWVSDLAHSNERYRTLFEMSNEGIFLCASVSDTFLTMNDNLCRWLGYTRMKSYAASRLLISSARHDSRTSMRSWKGTRVGIRP